ncbi:MAG: hypothetical protein KGJ13_12180, partial [Patescibacteria group bacterium]|nr:hypothetical protein [Patescibacteria group bacterium]
VNPNFQNIRLIPSNAHLDLESVPFYINFESTQNNSYGNVCFHIENATLAAALVKAINETLTAFTPAKSPEGELPNHEDNIFGETNV